MPSLRLALTSWTLSSETDDGCGAAPAHTQLKELAVSIHRPIFNLLSAEWLVMSVRVYQRLTGSECW